MPRLRPARWAVLGCALAILGATGLAAAAPGARSGAAPGVAARVCWNPPPAGGQAAPLRCPPLPTPVAPRTLRPGQLAIRGVMTYTGLCPVPSGGGVATPCQPPADLATPEGTVHLTGNTGALPNGTDVIATGAWAVGGDGLNVHVARLAPVRAACRPLPIADAGSDLMACPLE